MGANDRGEQGTACSLDFVNIISQQPMILVFHPLLRELTERTGTVFLIFCCVGAMTHLYDDDGLAWLPEAHYPARIHRHQLTHGKHEKQTHQRNGTTSIDTDNQ